MFVAFVRGRTTFPTEPDASVGAQVRAFMLRRDSDRRGQALTLSDWMTVRRTGDRGFGQEALGNGPRTRHDHPRCARTFALIVVAVLAVACIAGCGGATSAKDSAASDKAIDVQIKNEAVQDKLVGRATQLEQKRRRFVAAMRKSPRARAEIVSALRQRHGRQRAQTRTRVQVSSITTVDVCTPVGPRGGSRAQRQARRARVLQRQQTLYYLNLSCPSL